MSGHEAGVHDLAFSHDGEWLASCGWDNTITWDLTALQPVLRVKFSYAVFSLDGQTIVGATSADGRTGVGFFEFLHADNFRHAGRDFDSHAPWALNVTFHPDGRIAVASYVDTADNTTGLKVIDVSRGGMLGCIRCGVRAVRFDSSGSSLFTAGGSGFLRWPVRIAEGTVRVGPPRQLLNDPSVEHFDLSADGLRMAIVSPGTQRLSVIDTEHPERNKSFRTLADARFVALSPDGKWAAVSMWNGAGGGEVWDIDQGVLATKLDVPARTQVAFTPRGRWLVIHEPQQFLFVRPGDWQVAHRIDHPSSSKIGFSPDGRYMAISGSAMHLIDLDTAQEVVAFESPEPFAATACAFSPDGGTLAALTMRGAFLQLWDLRRIRSTLASMQLDWAHPPIPPAPPTGTLSPMRLETDLGFLEQISHGIPATQP